MVSLSLDDVRVMQQAQVCFVLLLLYCYSKKTRHYTMSSCDTVLF
jgi:hypothetical protein